MKTLRLIAALSAIVVLIGLVIMHNATKQLVISMLISFVSVCLALLLTGLLFRFVRKPVPVPVVAIGGILLIGGTLIVIGGFPPSPEATAIMVREFILSVIVVMVFCITWRFLEGKGK